mmetsp:Transcript_9651/g.32055  ORF Transcript_9651/g.32055 Transcript_9651/m.32055 type:complete len:266 (+) Transcript_9651:1299-2096(+)
MLGRRPCRGPGNSRPSGSLSSCRLEPRLGGGSPPHGSCPRVPSQAARLLVRAFGVEDRRRDRSRRPAVQSGAGALSPPNGRWRASRRHVQVAHARGPRHLAARGGGFRRVLGQVAAAAIRRVLVGGRAGRAGGGHRRVRGARGGRDGRRLQQVRHRPHHFLDPEGHGAGGCAQHAGAGRGVVRRRGDAHVAEAADGRVQVAHQGRGRGGADQAERAGRRAPRAAAGAAAPARLGSRAGRAGAGAARRRLVGRGGQDVPAAGRAAD